MRKLNLDYLRSDLASVDGLLAKAILYNDTIGQLQLNRRRNRLQSEIEDLQQTSDNNAQIALYFNGAPVLGARGIRADFAGAALDKFQSIIDKLFASHEFGSLGARGPVAGREHTQLMVTEIVRGSFGFVLNELKEQEPLCDTELKTVVDDAAKLLQRTIDPNQEIFDEATELLDARTLTALKAFFDLLDSNKATLRVVENDRDFTMTTHDISLAKSRIDETVISDNTVTVIGELLGILPEHRRFELRDQNGIVLSGTASKEAIATYLTALRSPEGATGRIWETRMQVKSVQRKNSQPKTVYGLIELITRRI